MSDCYVGEIRMFAGTFAPQDWAFCNGALLPIDGNETLFTLIGTTYGGDGQSTFGLPDLTGRIPVHGGQGPGLTNRAVGQSGGVESVTLSPDQIPAHTHALTGSTSPATSTSPTNAVWGTWNDAQYSVAPPDTLLAPDVLAPAGGSQPHDNMPPFVAVSFIIAMNGIFPSQN